MFHRFLGWLLGIERLESIDQVDFALAAPWAQRGVFWLILGVIALAVLAFLFYAQYQSRGRVAVRIGLGACRALLLAMLLLTLADPIIQLTVVNWPRPVLYVLFDGTDSMAIRDEYSPEQRNELLQAVGYVPDESVAGVAPEDEEQLSRIDLIRSLVAQENGNLFSELERRHQVRIEAMVFEGRRTAQLRRIDIDWGEDTSDTRELADQLSTDGQITALGSVLRDLQLQSHAGQVAGVLIFSDFGHNSGSPAVGTEASGRASPAVRMGVPVYTVGVGATAARDLAVDVQPPPRMRRTDPATIRIKVSHQAFDNETVVVELYGRPLEGAAAQVAGAEELILTRDVILNSPVEYLEIPYTPLHAGQFEFVARVRPADDASGEIIQENNTSTRVVNIVDDYLRLTFVEYEPTWEWRFVKEVFHRDELIGLRGFRTYLASSDPSVRRSSDLFLPTLTSSRSEFFENDVIFIGDMPGNQLSPRFCSMVKEFVGTFGGGLVVIAGPRFGPSELANTELADMLPVVLDPTARIHDEERFELQFTPEGRSTEFLQLGGPDNPGETQEAWANMGELPWYQPVAALHSQGTALAVHPQDLCDDGETLQPIIAVRPYGANGGEVVYIGFNELWRLRRMHGETYYKRFWGNLIKRLALSHALGAQKRFLVRTDRQQYQEGDEVIVTVEAYDENYEPLSAESLPGGLRGELVVPEGGGDRTLSIVISQRREGEFEARVPVHVGGEYRLRVRDPVSGQYREVRFTVAELSAERRSAVRDEDLQVLIAQDSGGRSYDLTTVSQFVDDLHVERVSELQIQNLRLWHTWLWFGTIVALMLTEWLFRKLNCLP